MLGRGGAGRGIKQMTALSRRAFLVSTGVALAAPLATEAQRSDNFVRVALLRPAPPSPELAHVLDAFKQGLAQYGYLERRNVTVEFRFPRGKTDRLSHIATELVRLKPNAILAVASSGVDAVRKATTTISIVALDLETDPVATGIITSLARPGGNVTGIFLDFPELGGKWLELVRQVAPQTSRVAILWDPATGRVPLSGAEAAAPSLGLRLQVLEARGSTDFEAVFRSAISARAEAMVILSSPVFNTYRRHLVDLAAKHRLPTIMPFPLFVEDGGLIAYGPDLVELYKQSGAMVGRILKGARPGDVPIERPTRFVLAVNTRTAKALGLTIPPSLLLRADQVIE